MWALVGMGSALILKLNWWVYLPLHVVLPIALPVVRFPLLFPEVRDKAVTGEVRLDETSESIYDISPKIAPADTKGPGVDTNLLNGKG